MKKQKEVVWWEETHRFRGRKTVTCNPKSFFFTSYDSLGKIFHNNRTASFPLNKRKK